MSKRKYSSINDNSVNHWEPSGIKMNSERNPNMTWTVPAIHINSKEFENRQKYKEFQTKWKNQVNSVVSSLKNSIEKEKRLNPEKLVSTPNSELSNSQITHKKNLLSPTMFRWGKLFLDKEMFIQKIHQTDAINIQSKYFNHLRPLQVGIMINEVQKLIPLQESIQARFNRKIRQSPGYLYGTKLLKHSQLPKTKRRALLNFTQKRRSIKARLEKALDLLKRKRDEQRNKNSTKSFSNGNSVLVKTNNGRVPGKITRATPSQESSTPILGVKLFGKNQPEEVERSRINYLLNDNSNASNQFQRQYLKTQTQKQLQNYGSKRFKNLNFNQETEDKLEKVRKDLRKLQEKNILKKKSPDKDIKVLIDKVVLLQREIQLRKQLQKKPLTFTKQSLNEILESYRKQKQQFSYFSKNSKLREISEFEKKAAQISKILEKLYNYNGNIRHLETAIINFQPDKQNPQNKNFKNLAEIILKLRKLLKNSSNKYRNSDILSEFKNSFTKLEQWESNHQNQKINDTLKTKVKHKIELINLLHKPSISLPNLRNQIIKYYQTINNDKDKLYTHSLNTLFTKEANNFKNFKIPNSSKNEKFDKIYKVLKAYHNSLFKNKITKNELNKIKNNAKTIKNFKHYFPSSDKRLSKNTIIQHYKAKQNLINKHIKNPNTNHNQAKKKYKETLHDFITNETQKNNHIKRLLQIHQQPSQTQPSQPPPIQPQTQTTQPQTTQPTQPQTTQPTQPQPTQPTQSNGTTPFYMFAG